MSACPACGAPRTEVCMACRGRKGGAARSKKKTKAVRANWATFRPLRTKKKKR